MPPHDLDQPVDATGLRALVRAGYLPREAFWAGLRGCHTPSSWAKWASRILLLTGSGLVLAGVVFFFAYNWAELHRGTKLGLLQVLVLGALAGGQATGFRGTGGRICLLAAAVLAGVSFAVFGQAYHTGADAFGFFAVWALVVFPWAVAGAFAPLWLLWLILVNLSLWFFHAQVARFQGLFSYAEFTIVAALCNGGALALAERFRERAAWLHTPRLRPVLLLAVLGPLSVPAAHLCLGYPSDELTFPVQLAAFLWLAALAAGVQVYRKMIFNAGALSLMLANGALMLLILLGRLLEEADLFQQGLGFFVLTAATVALSTLLVQAVRRMRRQHEGNGP